MSKELTRREKVKLLQFERDLELEAIHEKYKPKFAALKFKFNLNDILKDGWVRSWQYFARGNKNEWQFDKKTSEISSRTICIVFDSRYAYDENNEIIEVITYSGCPQRNIVDMEDLDYYFKNNH